MTPEELERRMEFIIEQQAQFAAHIGELREGDARLRDQQAVLTASLLRLAELMEESNTRFEERFQRNEERFMKTDDRLKDLAESQKRTDEQLRRTDEHLRETDERLNALIGLFERHVTGPGHAGRATQ